MNSNLSILPTNGIYLDEPLPPTQDPALVYLNRFPSAKSRYTQGRVILAIASWLNRDPRLINWSAFTHEHNAAIQNRAVQLFKPATARKYQAALRGIAESAWVLGRMTAEEYQRAVKLAPVRGDTPPAGRDLTQGEINALIHACEQDPTAAGPRDAAIISIMYVTLVRRDGIASLSLSDYDPNSGKLKLHGKGSQVYTAFVTNGAKSALDDWLALRGDAPGPMFFPVSQLGQILRSAEHISDQSVYNICRKRGREAGIPPFSPHDFRRTGIGEMLDRGADIATVGKIASQKDPKTTARYDRRPEEVKKTVAQKLHIPYTRRTS